MIFALISFTLDIRKADLGRRKASSTSTSFRPSDFQDKPSESLTSLLRIRHVGHKKGKKPKLARPVGVTDVDFFILCDETI